MDEHMTALDDSNKRLNSRLHEKICDYRLKDNMTKNAEHSLVRAIMLTENVQCGVAFDTATFDKANVYSEYSVLGQLSFHIYPIIHKAGKPIREDQIIESEFEPHTVSTPLMTGG